MIAVCFDKASTMSGNVNDVQMKCKKQNNKIMYVHCYIHLILIDVVRKKCNVNED